MPRRANAALDDVNVVAIEKKKTAQTPKIRIDHLNTFDPLTENQRKFFEVYKSGQSMIALHGVAGTGKTFCALYKALEECLDKGSHYHKVIVIRSAVQSREIGHLPGDMKEKTEVYTQPYHDICRVLFDRNDAFAKLEQQGDIEFVTTSFIRGTTFDDAIVIVDEMQNMNFEELDTVMTRLGRNSKVIWCGDYRQTDLRKQNDKSGILRFLNIAKFMGNFARIEFDANDIVRSELVKDYILAKLKYEDTEIA